MAHIPFRVSLGEGSLYIRRQFPFALNELKLTMSEDHAAQIVWAFERMSTNVQNKL